MEKGLNNKAFMVNKLQYSVLVPNVKVIIIDNFDTQPLETGKFLRWDRGTPIVNILHRGEVRVMGIVIPYTNKMYKFLSGLTRKWQWKIIDGIVNANTEQDDAFHQKLTT